MNTSVYIIKFRGAVCYVGIAVDVVKRWKEHVRMALAGKVKRPLYYAMRRHGIEAFEFEIIVDGIEWADACEQEMALIAMFGTRSDNIRSSAYNLTDGGEGWTRTKPRSVYEKIARKNTGKKRSDESKAKMSKAKVGKARDPLVMKKLHESNTGKKRSEEACKKIRDAKLIYWANRRAQRNEDNAGVTTC
jgi:group I intron endonuclease